MEENIYVVNTADLRREFSGPPEKNGKIFIQLNFDELVNSCITEGLFVDRERAEKSTFIKQIIPYVLFRKGGKVFVTQRKSEAREERLSGKLSVGIGGHINEFDLEEKLYKLDRRKANEGAIMNCLSREINEEISLLLDKEKLPDFEFWGLIWDDSDDVGKVHLGLLFVVNVDKDVQINIANEHKWGKFSAIEDILKEKGVEGWSEMVLTLIGNKKS